jgi:hypothetical protein
MSLTLRPSATAPADHVVLFYEQDRFLNECIADYVRQGLAENRDVLVIATAPHRHAVDGLLDRSPQRAGTDPRLTTLDARATLDDLRIDGVVDAGRIHDRFARWLAASNRSGRTPRIYGEMVALLWDDGQFERALQLETLWNRLGESFSFSLLCGYPMRGFADHDSTVSFPDVCRQHTAVTTESYAHLRDEHDDPGPMVVLNGGAPGGRMDPG